MHDTTCTCAKERKGTLMCCLSSSGALIGDTVKRKLTINVNRVKCCFLKRGENRSTRRKPLVAEKKTNKLSPHMMPSLESKPGHISGRQLLSPLPLPCTPKRCVVLYVVHKFSLLWKHLSTAANFSQQSFVSGFKQF